MAKFYLNEKRIEMPQLKENLPGVDWTKHFLRRHLKELSSRTASNIHRKRVAITPDLLDKFFNNDHEDLS